MFWLSNLFLFIGLVYIIHVTNAGREVGKSILYFTLDRSTDSM